MKIGLISELLSLKKIKFNLVFFALLYFTIYLIYSIFFYREFNLSNFIIFLNKQYNTEVWFRPEIYKDIMIVFIKKDGDFIAKTLNIKNQIYRFNIYKIINNAGFPFIISLLFFIFFNKSFSYFLKFKIFKLFISFLFIFYLLFYSFILYGNRFGSKILPKAILNNEIGVVCNAIYNILDNDKKFNSIYNYEDKNYTLLYTSRGNNINVIVYDDENFNIEIIEILFDVKLNRMIEIYIINSLLSNKKSKK